MYRMKTRQELALQLKKSDLGFITPLINCEYVIIP